jgi:hypothetical protein
MRRLARVVVLVLTAIGCTAAMTCLASAAPAGHHSGWGKAIEVPGSARLNKGGGAIVEAVWCAGAGNCSAAGTYTDASDHSQLFVVSERHGRWGRAEELPGTAKLNAGVNGTASIAGIFCQHPGDCSLAGNYDQANGFTRPFVARQRGGRWADARTAPSPLSLLCRVPPLTTARSAGRQPTRRRSPAGIRSSRWRSAAAGTARSRYLASRR